MKIITFPQIKSPSYPVGEDVSSWIEYIDFVIPLIKGILKHNTVNIWCRGSSGGILAGILASRADFSIIVNHVKKEGEKSHSFNCFGRNPYQNIILDDFSRYGDTINSITREMGDRDLDAIVLYNMINENIWRFDKVPKYLIVSDDRDAYNRRWESLKPGEHRTIKEDNNKIVKELFMLDTE